MRVREMTPDDTSEVLRLMRLLWPDCEDETIVDDAVLVVVRDDQRLGGFLALALRPWAEGCTSEPVAYVEGWWIDEDLRRLGWGRRLMEAAEVWARDHGSSELGSDVELPNAPSIDAHLALGFEEVQRSVAFRKRLAGPVRRRRCPRIRPDMPGLIAAGVLAASALGAARPADDELVGFFERILYRSRPEGREAWPCFELGIITDIETRNLVLAHLETWLARRGGQSRTLEPELIECFDRALFGQLATEIATYP